MLKQHHFQRAAASIASPERVSPVFSRACAPKNAKWGSGSLRSIYRIGGDEKKQFLESRSLPGCCSAVGAGEGAVKPAAVAAGTGTPGVPQPQRPPSSRP